MVTEMKRRKYTIDGAMVWVREQSILREAHLNKICPLCRGVIEEGDECKFIVNNYVLFPNCFVHSECFDKKSPEEALEWMHKDYEEYMKIIKAYECWG